MLFQVIGQKSFCRVKKPLLEHHTQIKDRWERVEDREKLRNKRKNRLKKGSLNKLTNEWTAERKQGKRKRDKRRGSETQKDKEGGGERRGNIPRSTRLIFRQTDKQRSQPANSTYQTDSDSLAAADFNMLRRSSVPKHFKLGKFKTYTLALGCAVAQNPPFNLWPCFPTSTLTSSVF